MSKHTRTARTLMAGTLVLLAGAAPLRAQSAPTLGYLGYMTAGMAVGGALGGAVGGTECDGFICIPAGVVAGVLVGGAGGLMAGGSLSHSVRASRDAGRPLSPGQMTALSLGSTLGGAALGALVSSVLIKPDGPGTFLGSDEQTFAILATAGAALGLYRAIQFRRSIVPENVRIRPGVMRDGRPGVHLSVRF